MEHIRQALDRAKQTAAGEKPREMPAFVPQAPSVPSVQVSLTTEEEATPYASQLWTKEIALKSAHLNSNRLVSHDISDVRSRPFDMLRTQVLQTMDKASWRILGVTSPAPGCGKSVIASNLAISMARQPGRQVLLVDLDLQKPQVANYLGLQSDHSLLDVLSGRTSLSSTIIRADIQNKHFLVLPCLKSTPHSSEWMASPAMSAMFQQIRQNYKDYTVILDLPPILTSDDVIAILPQMDCAIFVASVGRTTLAEIKDCNRHLDSTPVVQIVVNKASDESVSHYTYGY